MAGPGGAEVGRVYIKVVPDFTHFRKIMRAVLQEFDGKEINVKVKADAADLNNLARELEKSTKLASKQMSKDISKGLKDAGKKASKDGAIAPELDLKARYKKRLQSQLNKLFDELSVNINVKGVDNQALIEYWDKEFAQGQKQLNKLEVDMDSRAFSAQAAYVLATLNKIRRESEKLRESTSKSVNDKVINKGEFLDGLTKIRDMSLELQRLRAEAEAANRSLDRKWSFPWAGATNKDRAEALREYIYGFRELDGTVNKVASSTERFRLRGGIIGALLGGAASLGSLDLANRGLKAVGGQVTKVGDILSKFVPSFGTGFNAATYVLLASLITPVIALLSGLITVAPAAFAAIAVPISAIALGFEGIKKAAESVKPAFDKLRSDVAGVFEKGMVPGFNAIKDTLIPGLTESFKGVAGSLSTLFNEFNTNLAKQANMDNMNNIITNVGVAAQRAVPGVKNFTDGLLNLVSQLSNKFPGLSDAFNRTAESFVGWVDKITTVDASGTSQLDRAMKTLGETLSELGGIISDLFADGFNNLGNVKFGDSMKSFVQDIRSLINDVLPGLAKSFEGIATALSPITWTVDKISKVVGPLKDAFSNPETDKPFFEQSNMTKLLGGLGANFEQQIKDWWNGVESSAPEAVTAAAEKTAGLYTTTVAAAMAANKETQKAMLMEAFTGEGVTTAVQTQLTQQAQVAITGVQQALVPLKEGLQTDINAALQPLGDIAGKVQTAFDAVPGLVQGSLGQIPGIVQSAMGSLGTEADAAMRGVSEAVVTHCAAAVNTATTEAPRIKAPFEALKDGMVAVGNQMMAGLAAGISNSVGFAEAAASAAAVRVKAAADKAAGIRSPSREFMKTGDYMMQGMKIGIQDGTDGPVAAMREVMQAIKDVFGTAEGLNINFFMGQATSGMASLAASSREFRTNMTEVATTPQLSSGLDATQTDLADIKRQKAEIDVRLAELTAQKNATQDKAAKAALTAEMDQLRIQKERLDLLKEENGLQEDRKTAIQKLSDQIATSIVDMIKMPGEFAKTTANAAMQDLGISGSGALPTIANWALDAGTNFIFNVNNMDDAIQGQQAQQRKQAAGVTSR